MIDECLASDIVVMVCKWYCCKDLDTLALVQLTGSPLMYQDKLLEGLEICAIHMRSAVSPTWYCFLGVSIVGPSLGKSVMKESSFYIDR